MQAFENECMREILRVSWTRTLTTTTAYQLAVSTTTVLLHNAKARRMKYFGHILRQTEGLNRARSNDRINRRILDQRQTKNKLDRQHLSMEQVARITVVGDSKRDRQQQGWQHDMTWMTAVLNTVKQSISGQLRRVSGPLKNTVKHRIWGWVKG